MWVCVSAHCCDSEPSLDATKRRSCGESRASRRRSGTCACFSVNTARSHWRATTAVPLCSGRMWKHSKNYLYLCAFKSGIILTTLVRMPEKANQNTLNINCLLIHNTSIMSLCLLSFCASHKENFRHAATDLYDRLKNDQKFHSVPVSDFLLSTIWRGFR